MKGVLLVILGFFALQILAQSDDSLKTEVEKNFRAYPLPVVYYTPETRFAFGAVTLFNFRFKGESAESRNSQFQLGGAYTQNDQMLFYAPYQFFLKENKYNIFGQFYYYNYSYNFYGVGNDVPKDYEELYFVNIPRVRINATQLVRKNLYFGFRYWFDEFDIQETEENGLLSQNLVEGADGGTISSLGFVALYDSRDNYNYPENGAWFEILALPNRKELGSDFNFIRFSLDYVKYHKVASKSVFVVNLFGVSNFGEVPFNEMAFIGGRSKMRGYYEGRFRDKHLWMVQAEWRQEIKGKIGAVAFGGVGGVASEINNFELNNIVPSAGLGIRYRMDESDKINIRLDYGVGLYGSSGIYLTFGEAF